MAGIKDVEAAEEAFGEWIETHRIRSGVLLEAFKEVFFAGFDKGEDAGYEQAVELYSED